MIYIIIIILNFILKIFIKNTSVFNSIINPIFWITFSILLFFILPKKYINKKKDNRMFQISAIVGLIYIIIYSIFGVLVTFGKNPYSNSLKGIIINFWITGVAIICKEYGRFKIIGNTKKNKKALMSILVVVVFSINEIDIISLISSFGNASLLFRQLVSDVIPIVSKNVLFTHMATKYSYKPAIIYQLLINMFFWISPILPNSPWILIAILDTVIYFIFYFLVKMEIDDKDIALGRARKEKTDIKGTVAFGIIITVIACFATGMFPIEPKAVATASMQPTIHIGDVALIKKCDINDVDIGDIIEYQIESQFVIHRIINKEVQSGEIILITQGDNNSSADAKPVRKEQIVGKVVNTIKYIGLPAVWINRLKFTNEEILVETGK